MSAIVPSGAPAWVRSNDHTVYGGNTEKTNYQSQGVVNPRTDVGAEAIARMAADLEACARTAAFCELTIQCDDATPANPTVLVVNQMSGSRVVSYAGGSPPAGFPYAIRVSNGVVDVNWASSYNDPYSVAGAVNIKHALAAAHGTSALATTCSVSSTTSVRVYVWNVAAGTAATSPKFTLEVGTA